MANFFSVEVWFAVFCGFWSFLPKCLYSAIVAWCVVMAFGVFFKKSVTELRPALARSALSQAGGSFAGLFKPVMLQNPPVKKIRTWRRKKHQLVDYGLFYRQVTRFFSFYFSSFFRVHWIRDLTVMWQVHDFAYCWYLHHRILLYATPSAHMRRYRRYANYPWRHGALLMALSFRLREPDLLFSWLNLRMRRMNMFTHKRFFRILGLLLRLQLRVAPQPYRLTGVYLYVVGKISVTGNAMSRSLLYRAGKASSANLTQQTSRGFYLTRTPTGCLGVTLHYFF